MTYKISRMPNVAISDLKARLSEYLARVRAGEEITVTDRGVPVAQLTPVSYPHARREALADLERKGMIRLGRGTLPAEFWRMPRPQDPQGTVLQALLDERREGR